MKKSLVVTLALVFVLGIAGTAFAAANPFVDVPAKHWAYDAVSKLAQAGIVDGYNDGTFRGDKTMTRYEMAQIVAKAMTRSDKASAENKALVDKLAVEFNAELQNLGVRVAKLEANQANMKFSGQLDMRYRAIDYNQADKSNGTDSYYRLRMNGTAKVDENTTIGIRFTTLGQDPTDFRNNSWRGSGATTSGNAAIDRVFVSTKLGVVNTTVGRQALVIDPYQTIVDNGFFSFDGVKMSTKSNNFTFTGQYGRVDKNVVIGNAAAAAKDASVSDIGVTLGTIDVASFEVASNIGKLSYNVDVAQFKDNGSSKNVSQGDLYKYVFGNLGYKFDNKWFLGGEYGKNSVDDGGKFYAVKAIYGNMAPAKKGDYNITTQFTKVNQNSISDAMTTLDTPWVAAAPYTSLETAANHHFLFDAYKVFDVNYNYAFSKNLLGQLQYVKVTDSDNDNGTYNYYKVTLSAKF